MANLSKLLMEIEDSLPKGDICLIDIVSKLEERGIGLLLFVFALPAAIPLPGLGINLIIALPLLFLTAQQAMGKKHIRMPKKMETKCISHNKLNSILKTSLPYVKKIEKFINPRLKFMAGPLFSRLSGVAGVIMSLSICVPLPLTNTAPAFGIALMGVGLVMRDGLAVLGGMIFGLAWVAMLVFVSIYLGEEGFQLVKEAIKSVFPL